MKINEYDIQRIIHSRKEDIKDFESMGNRGSRDSYQDLAQCELLLGDMKKAREYFEEADKSWLWYLDHNKEYIKSKWDSHSYLTCYKRRMFIQFFAYGEDKAKDYSKTNLDKIEKFSEDSLRFTEKGWGSDDASYEEEIILYANLIVKNVKSSLEVIKDIYERYEKSSHKTYKKSSKYPTALHAKLTADIAKGIIEKDKDMFLNGLRELSELQEHLIEKIVLVYADIPMIFVLEIARQTWPDLVVDSPFIPEKLRNDSYFKELDLLGRNIK